MHIGASLLMITVGAITTFGLRYNPGWIDLDTVGWVFMLVGAAGLIANHFVWERRKAAAHANGSAGDAYGDHFVDEPYTLSYPDPALDTMTHVEPPTQDPRVND
jgi:hypothetical protein